MIMAILWCNHNCSGVENTYDSGGSRFYLDFPSVWRNVRVGDFYCHERSRVFMGCSLREYKRYPRNLNVTYKSKKKNNLSDDPQTHISKKMFDEFFGK